MAGRGPLPKDARLRQRTNRKAGAAALEARTSARAGNAIPELFERRCPCGGAPVEPMPKAKRKPGRPPKPKPACDVCLGSGVVPWHRWTLAWWRDVWTSEVSDHYLRVDLHGLYRLACLVDRYHHGAEAGEPDKNLAAEIRLQQMPYGHNPGDRSRLQWEVERPESRAPEDATADEPAPMLDSRKVLRMLG